VGQVFEFCNTHQFQVFEKKNQRFFKYHWFQVFEKNSESKELLGLEKKKQQQQIRFKEPSVLGISQNFKNLLGFMKELTKGFSLVFHNSMQF